MGFKINASALGGCRFLQPNLLKKSSRQVSSCSRDLCFCARSQVAGMFAISPTSFNLWTLIGSVIQCAACECTFFFLNESLGFQRHGVSFHVTL